MTESDYMKKFQKELKTMFRSEDKDFNWGIYRIMNQKNEEITKYIEKELPKIVEEKLSKLKGDFSQTIDEELKKLEQNLRNAGVDPNTSPKYKELLSQKKKGVSLKEFEEQIYNHLLEFFSRYYQDGDFINQFYFKDDTYLIPYDGSEVTLHWATKDMYYVKSSDQYQRFSFLTKDEKKSVLLKLVSREEEKGNQKGRDKHFIFDSLKWNDNELICNVCYASSNDEIKDLGKNKTERQIKLNEEIYVKIKEELGEHATGLDILKNIKKFQKRYVEDFFVHKDLKGFLESQMNIYINQEILNVDSLIDESGNFNEDLKIVAKVFKDICKNIIEKLSLLEKLKKKIWEKKKFVLDTNYVITLDKIKEFTSEEILEGIIDEILSSEKQIEEWQELFGFNIKNKNDLCEKKTYDGKIEYKKLPIDTRYFDDEFNWNLLSRIDNIDQKLNGLLIHSENWQALNLLKNKYENKVNCCYIDPPYNTENEEFLYKDTYKHSSWITLLENRISILTSLMNNNGLFFSSIDENERDNLNTLLGKHFDLNIGDIVIHRKRGRDNSARDVSKSHDYLLVNGKTSDSQLGRLPISEDTKKAYSNRDNDPRGDYRVLGLWARGGQGGSSYEYTTKDGYHFSKRLWLVNEETMNKYDEENRLIRVGDNLYRKLFLTEHKGSVVESIWTDVSNNANAADELKALFGSNPFSNPKPTPLIEKIIKISIFNGGFLIDFFAGSGTTADAALRVCNELNIKINIILIEMGNHFNNILLNRIKKILYSFKWKSGKPESSKSIGGFFKYHDLEQYEDSLENIVLKQSTLEMFNENLDILLKYYLDDGIDPNKTKNFLGVDTEKEFLDLRINVLNKDGTTRQQKVDLIETFNYLIGLEVNQMKKQQNNNTDYYIITGKIGDDKAIIFWRDPKQITDKESDKDFINTFLQKDSYKHVFVNSDCNIKNYKNIYDEMRKRLW